MRDVRLATTLVVCLIGLGVTSTAAAQTFELTPFAGWRFGGGFDDLATGADVDLDDGLSYGVILGIPWNDPHRSRLELIWSRQDTTVGGAGAGDPGVRPRRALPPRQRHGAVRDLERQAGHAALDRRRRDLHAARHRRRGVGGPLLGQRRRRSPVPRLRSDRHPARGPRVVHLHRAAAVSSAPAGA